MGFTPSYRAKCAEIGFDLDAFMATPRSTSWDHEQQTFVYILGCEQYVKVGIARDVAKRVNGLQMGNPFPIKVLRTVEYPSRLQALLVERTIHAALEPHRLFSEWFTCEAKRARDVTSYVVAAMRQLVVIHAQQHREARARWDASPKGQREASEVQRFFHLSQKRIEATEAAGEAFDREHGFSRF